jgi:hypothetical protein
MSKSSVRGAVAFAVAISCISGLQACGSSEDRQAAPAASYTEPAPPSDAQHSELAAAEAREAAEPAPASTEAAMMVFVDPETGRRSGRPVTEEQHQAAVRAGAALNRSSEGLEVVRMPDGSLMMDLKGRFQNFSVVHRSEDGSLRMDCDTNEERPVAPISARPTAAKE